MDLHELAPGSIIAAHDGSAHAERALEWAALQAVREGRRLDVLHVVGADETRTAVWSTAGGGSAEDVRRDTRDTARAMVNDAVEGLRAGRPGLEVGGVVLDGRDPRDVLVAASHLAHLLVLGSRGRGPVSSLLLGSVSAAVTQLASCPVVVARPTQDRSDTAGAGIVVGADASAASLPVIEFAFRQAALSSLPLTVVHCYHDVVVGAGYAVALPESETEEVRVALSESVAGMAEKFPDVEVTRYLQRGLTQQALTSGDRPWDLIVVGRRDRGEWERVLVGSVGRAVLEHAKSTVAVVPERSA